MYHRILNRHVYSPLNNTTKLNITDLLPRAHFLNHSLHRLSKRLSINITPNPNEEFPHLSMRPAIITRIILQRTRYLSRVNLQIIKANSKHCQYFVISNTNLSIILCLVSRQEFRKVK